jgi:hypothetical protein
MRGLSHSHVNRIKEGTIRGLREDQMTVFERWGKGIGIGICVALGWMLADKFWGVTTSGGWAYFAIAWVFVMGWLGGSAEERKLRKPLITE